MVNSRTEVHITTGSQKMEHFISINTSSLTNEFCQKMTKTKNAVCTKCYSDRYAKLRPSLEKRLIQNSELLSSRLLTDEEIPFFNARYARFNAFGEIINDTHYKNLMKMAEMNPFVTFGLWTKRADIVMKYPKIKNIKYIYSANTFNKDQVKESILNYFDKIFTVYTDKTVEFNCHGKCISCLICYTDNDVKFIKEKQK